MIIRNTGEFCFKYERKIENDWSCYEHADLHSDHDHLRPQMISISEFKQPRFI
jgi:hypothetical protein